MTSKIDPKVAKHSKVVRDPGHPENEGKPPASGEEKPADGRPATTQTNGKPKRGTKRGGGKARSSATAASKDALTVPDAIAEVLKGKRNPMGAREITEEIQRRKLARSLGGKTPHATVGATLATNGRFERVSPGKFKLAAK